jgi:thiol-disulfide isomerase/thioredoxin
MDNISVRVLKNEDVIVTSVPIEKYNPVGTSIPVKVTIENNGANPLTTFNFSWTLGENTYSDVISGLNINTRGTSTLTHSVPFVSNEVGEFPVTIQVDNPNNMEDGDPTNDSGSRKLYLMSEQLPKKVIVEEGTGTWCGWCPRGFVIMEKIAEDYPEIALPIAIHNNDPMVFAQYDADFSRTISGYPSGHVDRKELDIDPDHPTSHYGFDDAIVNLDSRMVPIQLQVETSYNEDTRTVQIKAVGQTSIATLANNLRFSCVITEDDVRGVTAAYNQVNYYANNVNGPMGGFESLPDPVPANQMVYNFVARALLGGYEGIAESVSPVLEANEYFEADFTYQVPAGYNVNNMKAIVFILDDETGEILNGNDAPLAGTLSVPLIPSGKSSIYPNPASDFVHLNVEYQTDAPVSVKIYTTYGQLVKDIGILNLSDGKAFEKINVASMQSGMYILELRHKNSVTALPFTKL